MDAMDIAKACGALGAGRSSVGCPINHAVGVEIEVEVGDKVEEGNNRLFEFTSTFLFPQIQGA
jgi:thymidine phosphorylase